LKVKVYFLKGGTVGIKFNSKNYEILNNKRKEVITVPRGDGTGPTGVGPMTGRAAGYCAGYQMPGYTNPIHGRGWFGFGRSIARSWFGRGRGFRHWYWATGLPGWARAGGCSPYYGMFYGSPYSPQEEVTILREQAKIIENELNTINERISELERQAQSEEKK
jgi:hypothetical protein